MDGFFSKQPKNNSVSEICLFGFMVKGIVFKNLFQVLSINKRTNLRRNLNFRNHMNM